MNESGFTPETLAFLQQYGQDLQSAIAAAPDAELQQVSQAYREARQTADEATVKRAMAGASGADQRAEPTTDRMGMLEQMLSIATDPGLLELIENELQTERTIQEHLHLMQMADGAGDDDLADEIGRRLRALMDLSDEDPEQDLLAQAEELPLDAAVESAADPAGEVMPERKPDTAAMANKLQQAWGAVASQ
jgi:hypothetical protein